MCSSFNCIWFVCRCLLNSAWKSTNMTSWFRIFVDRLNIDYLKRVNVVVEERKKRRSCERSDERKWCMLSCLQTRERTSFFRTELSSSFFWENERTCEARIKTKNRRRVCETLLKNITSKRMKLHKDLFKSKNSFAIHMRTKRIKLTDYFFFRRVLIVLTSDCLCEHSRQTLRHILLFCREWSESRQRMLRDDETTDMSKLLNTTKSLKASIIWLMKINLLTQFSLTRKYLD
jgi:hypothetical protein